jgi:hypothetical protein
MAKTAVLIGINKYKIPGADLRGCVNDVINIKDVLTKLYGFKPADISSLTDFAATKKAMQDAIAKAVRGAKKGDVVLIHFSGHGANVPDDNGDEADNRDEILCPTNLDWKDPLRDDWLRKTFDSVKDGVNLTVIMDCCHSGSNTRAIVAPDAPIMSRYLPNPWDMMAEESGRALRGKVRVGMHGASRAARQKKDVVKVDIEEVLITGCRDTQTSADARIGGSFNGALTYSMAETIRAAKGKLSYADLHKGTLAKLKAGGFEQVPQLEGRGPRLSMEFLAPIA